MITERKIAQEPETNNGPAGHEIGCLSPLGPLRIVGRDSAVWRVEFGQTQIINKPDTVPEPLRLCSLQLAAYFEGTRKTFDLPLAPQGTAFQKRVWERLLGIQYGETLSYREIAEDIGNPRAARAVGRANARNPVSIIIPCHRVVGSGGGLVGYGGGLWRKQWLLNHERG